MTMKMKKYVLVVSDSAKRVCRVSARCLLAVLLYGCDASLGAGGPSSAPEPLKKHATSTQKGDKNVAQRNATVSAPSQPEGDHEPFDTTTTNSIDSKAERLGAVIHNNGGRELQYSEPFLDPQEILNRKLADPELELSSTQSISLIEHCAQLGEQNAARVAGEDILVALGNAGVGKSATINYLMGCEMELVRPSEVGLGGRTRVVVVAPTSSRPEIVSIMHEETSRVFLLPKLARDSSDESRAYCDFLGFGDNRGAEINIANTINIRKVLQQAKSVKLLYLASYHDLTSGRGRGWKAMMDMCIQMFGGIDNLRKHQHAVLLGISNAPLYEDGEPLTRDLVHSLLTQSKMPATQIFADRFFLFDPLDRGGAPDFWPRECCRDKIAELDSIPQHEAQALFQTVLTDNDQVKLSRILRDQGNALESALERGDYQASRSYWQSLTRLKVIENDEVEQLIREHVLARIDRYVSRFENTFSVCISRYQFDQAEQQLALFRMLPGHFPNESLSVALTRMETLLKTCKERNTAQRLKPATQKAAR
jgi:hypothetical protein